MSDTSGSAAENPRAVIGANNPPADELIRQEIEDLFEEAKNFCDGEPITTAEMAEAITKLHDSLHEAGKRAEDMRVAEKKPHDDAAKAVQAKWNPYTQDKKGKVALGKDACASLLTPWRARLQAEAAEVARLAAEEAERVQREAQAAMVASRGDLSARVEAEELVAHAKDVAKAAKRADKAATTGTGLRTTWVADLVKPEDGLDWAYSKDATRFLDVVQQMANEAVRNGARQVPGFVVREERKAS